jgi:hypothetical protein
LVRFGSAGEVSSGMVCHGEVRLGLAGHDKAGKMGLGMARSGEVWRVMAGLEKGEILWSINGKQ